MIRAMAIAQTILIASVTVVREQHNNAGQQPPKVLSATGTMYDGNNANLQLPAEPNEYWVQLWAAPISERNAGPGSNVPGPAAAAPVGAPSGAGVH